MFVHKFVPKVELYVVADDDETAKRVGNGICDSLRFVLSEAREDEAALIMSSLETPKNCSLVGAVNPKAIEKLGEQLSLPI